MRQPLRALLELLPTSQSTFQLSEHRAIKHNPETVSGYIWPDVDVPEGTDLESAVLLIAAPGAMGKSEAAKGISKLLNTLYIDLSKIHVGNGTLIGELTRVLDVVPLQEFRDQVRNGTATLVLDSTDEAQLRSGFENFSQFLKDLDWFIDSSVRGPRVVLLGRSDSISLTEIALKLIDRPAPVIELQPLGFDQSTSYIDTTLNRSDYELHKTHSEPFSRLRDAVFSNLSESLTGKKSGQF